MLFWARHKTTKFLPELLTGATLKAEAEAHSAARERALNFMVNFFRLWRRLTSG
jgi:hypothetical protein